MQLQFKTYTIPNVQTFDQEFINLLLGQQNQQSADNIFEEIIFTLRCLDQLISYQICGIIQLFVDDIIINVPHYIQDLFFQEKCYFLIIMDQYCIQISDEQQYFTQLATQAGMDVNSMMSLYNVEKLISNDSMLLECFFDVINLEHQQIQNITQLTNILEPFLQVSHQLNIKSQKLDYQFYDDEKKTCYEQNQDLIDELKQNTGEATDILQKFNDLKIQQPFANMMFNSLNLKKVIDYICVDFVLNNDQTEKRNTEETIIYKQTMGNLDDLVVSLQDFDLDDQFFTENKHTLEYNPILSVLKFIDLIEQKLNTTQHYIGLFAPLLLHQFFSQNKELLQTAIYKFIKKSPIHRTIDYMTKFRKNSIYYNQVNNNYSRLLNQIAKADQFDFVQNSKLNLINNFLLFNKLSIQNQWKLYLFEQYQKNREIYHQLFDFEKNVTTWQMENIQEKHLHYKQLDANNEADLREYNQCTNLLSYMLVNLFNQLQKTKSDQPLTIDDLVNIKLKETQKKNQIKFDEMGIIQNLHTQQNDQTTAYINQIGGQEQQNQLQVANKQCYTVQFQKIVTLK